MTLTVSRLAVSVAAACLIAAQPAPASAQEPGEALYAKRCAMCHDKDVPRAPRREALRLMSPEAIFGSLQGGTMLPQAVGLSLAEKRAIAVYAAGKDFGTGTAAAGRCAASAPAFTAGGPEWAGWGAGPENARFQPKPGLSPADLSRLKVRWAFGFPGSILAYGAPVVAGGRVYVGSAGGEVYALDLGTGCIHWSYTAEASVRAAPSVGRLKDGRTAVFFGDQGARLYALDAARGTPLWQIVVDDQIAAVITGAPKLHDGRLYVPISVVEDILTPIPNIPAAGRAARSPRSMRKRERSSGKSTPSSILRQNRDERRRHRSLGSLGREHLELPHHRRGERRRLRRHRQQSLESADRHERRHPRVRDGDRKAAVEAAAHAGWRCLEHRLRHQRAQLSRESRPRSRCRPSTILRTLPGGRRVLIAGAKSSKIHALDPDKNGAVLWTDQLGRGGALGGIEWGMAADDTTVYVPLSDLSFGTDMMAGKLSPAAGGGLFAYRFADGRRLWHAPAIACGGRPDCSPAQSQAVTAIPGAVFSGTLGGLLRAYSTDDGRVLWEFDTVRDFETVNGVKARGGTLNGAGPVVAGGMVLVGSGYGRFGQTPGNVLLCLSVDGR